MQEMYGLILGWEDLLEEEMATHSGKILWRRINPLQYSYLENTMDRGAWWATVHVVTDMTVLDMTEHALACMHRKYTEKKIKNKKIYLASGHI